MTNEGAGIGTALLLVGSLGMVVGLWIGTWFGETRHPCAEDQAYVVAIDRNPDHGLTWVCRNLDELKGRQP